jgi:hypothetical protein
VGVAYWNLRMAKRVAEGASAVTVIPAKLPSKRKIFFPRAVEVGQSRLDPVPS